MTDDTKRAENHENNAITEPQAANENNPVAVLEAQVAELRDKFLRAAAEAENVRKRAERDVADERVYGITGFARDILVVADNLARTLDAVGAEARVSAEGPLKALLDGVELTSRELPPLPPSRVRGARRERAGGHGRPSYPAGVRAWGARAAAGHGRCLQGRPQDGAGSGSGATAIAGQFRQLKVLAAFAERHLPPRQRPRSPERAY